MDLDSLLQTPLGLQDQDAPAPERPTEGCCFLQAVQTAYTQLAALIHLYGGVHGLRLDTQRVGVSNKRQRKADVRRKWSNSSS